MTTPLTSAAYCGAVGALFYFLMSFYDSTSPSWRQRFTWSAVVGGCSFGLVYMVEILA